MGSLSLQYSSCPEIQEGATHTDSGRVVALVGLVGHKVWTALVGRNRFSTESVMYQVQYLAVCIILFDQN